MRKILTVILAIVIAILPMNVVFAADTHVHDDVTFTAWSGTTSLPTAAGNYCLTNDVLLDETWEPTMGGVNLCLNGHEITCPETVRMLTMIKVNAGRTLNVFDCTDSGTVTGYGEGIENRGVLTVNGGTIIGTSRSLGMGNCGYGICNSGTLIVNGGNIQGFGYESLGIENRDGAVTINRGTVSAFAGVDVNGGSLTVNGGTVISDSGTGIFIHNSGTATVKGGSIIGDYYGIYNLGDKLYLSGNAKISGGKADIELRCYDNTTRYITIVDKLENTDPYTVVFTDSNHKPVSGNLAFTNTAAANLEYNDPTRFASAVEGYTVIKNDNGQLQFVYKPSFNGYLVDLLDMTEEEVYTRMVEWFGEDNVIKNDVEVTDEWPRGIYEAHVLAGFSLSSSNAISGTAYALFANGKIAYVGSTGFWGADSESVPETIEGWKSRISYADLIKLFENSSCKTELVERDIGEAGAKVRVYLFYIGDIVLGYQVQSYSGTFDDATYGSLTAYAKWYIDLLLDRTDDSTPGDLNDDGKVNSTDSVLLLRYLAGFTDADVNIAAADYNQDGSVNSLDSVLLLRHLAGLS